MSDIRLFVCCHENRTVGKHPLIVPIQVGAALAQEHFPGFLYDDTGDNISKRNRSYCELTAQYWVWKNYEADYYGFFHYRRYLYPDLKQRRPYIFCREPSVGLLSQLGYEHFPECIESHDIILPKREDMRQSVKKHYARAPYHHAKDLELMSEILSEMRPESVPSWQAYLSQTAQYFGNMFIMRKTAFNEYCSWLFPLLFEFDNRVDTAGYSPQELRVDGYIAERLLGCWAEQNRDRWSIAEIPKVEFRNEGYWRARTKYFLLPPGTRRRSIVKNMGRLLHGK